MSKVILVFTFLLFLILAVSQCGSEPPTECDRARDSAIDFELYKNPGNYSQAGHYGEYAKAECLRKKESEHVQNLTSAEKITFKEVASTSTDTQMNERVVSDIAVRDDIAYAPNENEPFTGRYETYYPNGTKKGVAHIKNGKYDGLMSLWDESGQKTYEKIIKNGIEIPVNEENKVKKSTVGFGSFRSEAETAKKELQCPNSVDSDITPALYEGAGSLYGCIQGKMETVKWFINESPKPNEVKNVKFLWNDWFKDMGFGIHSDKEEAQKALKVLIKLYAPEKSKEVYGAFFGNTSKTITSAKFVLEYTYDRGPAIDERMIIVTEK
jgi:hypothetical protein